MSDNGNRVEPWRVLVVEFEPTHYKTDLWNVISGSEHIDLLVIHTQTRNWDRDGGHDYQRFPRQYYAGLVLSGYGVVGVVRSTACVMKSIIARMPDVVLVCGYSHAQAVLGFLTAFVLRRRFVIYVDEFNNGRPPGKFSFLKWVVRESLRKFIFSYGKAVFVCGQKGVESAVTAGCAPEKIHDFPYTVDLERILRDAPEDIPEKCLSDVRRSEVILFFSGRMIVRKGLPSLLSALSTAEVGKEWVLWIEGAGPELENYIALARQYNIAGKCRFLGFCQYDLHSWLIRSADIVIVPSLQDNWGIVVDEGLQLGKVVVSSDATGSGYDRVVDKVNGYIFPAGDASALAKLLAMLVENGRRVSTEDHSARFNTKVVRPIDNLKTLLEVVRA
ncbi:MAG: glycosyltransferase family 4 protein [Gammaproteobacteria bacterium]|nr:glycosyltransferase family 4 protein [Gammaproteobacteria bacterium]